MKSKNKKNVPDNVTFMLIEPYLYVLLLLLLLLLWNNNKIFNLILIRFSMKSIQLLLNYYNLKFFFFIIFYNIIIG